MTTIEMMWGLIAIFCVFGMGFIVGITGTYSKYLDASTKMIQNMDKWMNDGMEITKKIVDREM